MIVTRGLGKSPYAGPLVTSGLGKLALVYTLPGNAYIVSVDFELRTLHVIEPSRIIKVEESMEDRILHVTELPRIVKVLPEIRTLQITEPSRITKVTEPNRIISAGG